MPVLTRTEQELIQKGLDHVLTTTPVTATGRGSTVRSLIEIAANQVSALHDRIALVRRDAFLSTAEGDALDLIGETWGVKRGISLRAFDDSNNVRFYLDPGLGETAGSFVRGRLTNAVIDANPETLSSTGFTIRENITLTGRAGITYRTTHAVTFSDADSEQFVSVIAGGIGPAYNVQSGELSTNNISDIHPEFGSMADFILVENTMPIQTGRFSESDESYRFRLRQAFSVLQGGNQASVMDAVLSVPGVRDATFLPYVGGLGTFSVVIRSQVPIVSDGLQRAAQTAVNQVVAAGNVGNVVRPSYQGLQVKVALEYRPRADRITIRQKVRRAGVDYVNSLELGENFVLNELIQRMLETDDHILDAHFDVFGSGPYDANLQTITAFLARKPTNLNLPSRLHAWYTNDRLFTACDA